MSRPPIESGERAFLASRGKVQRLDAQEIESHLARALSRDHWASVAPDLSIEGAGAPGALEARALDPGTRDALLEKLAVEGYFRTERFLCEEAVGAMRRCVEALVAAGWPAVFAYVFDAVVLLLTSWILNFAITGSRPCSPTKPS